MTLTPAWLDELRNRTVLSALIGRTVKLTRAGREFKACCPFHDEKTPSFTINDDKGFYHCFGCSAHGDAIRWMTDQRGLPFIDAVKELAAAAGMDVPAADPRAAARAEQALSLRDVTEASARWFTTMLADADGTQARAYLEKRGLTPATIAAFGIGYAPDSRVRLREVLAKYGDAAAVETGMLIRPPEDAPVNRREPYDRFRDRIMIPIRDIRGRTIAFGGRILGAGEPKYLNSPDTPLFDKGRVLYNLDRASPAARKAGRLIVVEGYMDVIALAQAGIDEAVAPLGTALTEAQIELAWRQAPVPLLAFDGDGAGQRAALRAATRALPLLRPGHSLAFLTLPTGQDPDDIVSRGGRDAFDALANDAEPLVDLLWRSALAACANDTPEARAGVRQTLMGWADTIVDRDIAAHYRQRFRERLDAAFFAPRPRAVAQPRGDRPFVRRDGSARYAPPERPPSDSLRGMNVTIDTRWIQAIIAGILRYPSRLSRHAEALATLPVADAGAARLLNALIDIAFERGAGLSPTRLLDLLAEQSLDEAARALLRADVIQFSFTRSAVVVVAQEGSAAPPSDAVAMRDLDEAIAAIVAWPEVERALAAATEAARTNLDASSFEAQQRLVQAKAGLTERLLRLGDSGGP